MNIALILPGFSASAQDWAIPALQHLARELARQHNVTVFSLRYPNKGIYHFDGLVHHAVGEKVGYQLNTFRVVLRALYEVWQYHRRKPFDIIHAFWAEEAGLVATWAGKAWQRPSLVSFGGWELANLPHIHYGAQLFLLPRLIIKHVLQRADKVTAGSGYQLDLAKRYGVAAAKLHFAPLGVDLQSFQPSPSPPAALSLIQVASLLPVKNQVMLWQILHEVKKTWPDIHLNLVGQGPLEQELMTLAQQLGIIDNITWHRQVSHLALPPYYQQSGLYVQTSWHESQGMAVLEAMACGLPVIGTPVGVVPEVACLPPSFSATDLAQHIITLKQSPELYRHYAHLAWQQVQQTFSLEQARRNFEALYQQLIK